MTTARTLARATRRKIAEIVGVPSAVAATVEQLLVAEMEIQASIAALATLTRPNNVLAQLGYIPTAPDLTAEEWAKLAEMMADGRLPLMHSFPELTRALLKLCEDKP